MEISYTVVFEAPEWAIMVDSEDLPNAHYQLQSYWQENAPQPERAVDPTVIDSGWYGVLAYLGIIWSIPALQGWVDTDLRQIGALHAAAVQEGELWRAATALTLHSDLAHIASNSVFGVLFGLFVGRYLGSGFGWLLVLGCGALANLVNGLIQHDNFRAIGASTATFAALGLVPAFGWRRGYFRGQGYKRGFAPLFGAIAILVFTGFGAGNIDVGGHLLGFLMGIGAGLWWGRRGVPTDVGDQQRAGIAATALLLLAWGLAF
ncbi:MAG: rhomboid family intramembrane serine protease [Pseudomonadota bacterium]